MDYCAGTEICLVYKLVYTISDYLGPVRQEIHDDLMWLGNRLLAHIIQTLRKAKPYKMFHLLGQSGTEALRHKYRAR